MRQPNVLDRVRIASPCPASWAAMSGDERMRFCALCSKHVYNISAMSTAEAVALIEETEGNLCARIYRRRDGTVLTADCPVGVRALARRVRRLVAGAALGVAGVITGGAYLRATAERDSSCSSSQSSDGSTELMQDGEQMALGSIAPISQPAGPMAMLEDWYDWTLIKLGIRQPPVYAGFIGVVPWSSTPSPTPPPPPDDPDAPAAPEAPQE
jgi:hypothetical protein